MYRRIATPSPLSTPSCLLMKPSIQTCLCLMYRAICMCPASLMHPDIPHICWPSAQCTGRRFTETHISACDFLDKEMEAMSTCTHIMLTWSDHTLGQCARAVGLLALYELWGFLLSSLVTLLVPDLRLTHLSEFRQAEEVVTFCNCNHVKVL